MSRVSLHSCGRDTKKASEAERQALEAGDHLFFCGADADKAARSRHPIGIILALCSDKPIDDARLKILSKSDDWLIRASVARRNGLALSVREDLAGDEHPLVRALSKQGL